MHIALLGPIYSSDLDHSCSLNGVKPVGIGYPGAPFLGTLAKEIKAQGIRVSAITTDRTGIGSEIIRRDGNIPLYVCRARKNAIKPNGFGVGKLLDFYKSERRIIANVLSEIKPDCVYAHWTYEFALAAIESGLPHMVLAHDSPKDVFRSDPSIYGAFRLLLSRRVIREARCVLAVSPYIESRILKDFGRKVDGVLPNPLPLATIDQIRTQTFGERRKQIAFVCNYWGSLKNPKVALKAFSIINKMYPEYELKCIGYDFGESGVAHSWAKNHKLDKNVQFCGGLPHLEVLRETAHSSMLLHTSLTESFGMSVAESMALRTPVVAHRTAGAVPWLLEEGAAGWLTDVTSIDAVVRAISEVIKKPSEASERATRAELRISALCAPRAIALSTIKHLHELD